MNELIIKKEELIKEISRNGIGDLLKPLTKEIHLGDFTVFNLLDSYVVVISTLKKGQTLVLKKENFDSSVVLETVEGKKVGELDFPENKIFAKLLDAGKKLSAKVDYCVVLPEYNSVKIDVYLIDF